MPTYFTSQAFTAPLRTGFEAASLHEVGVGDFNGDGKLDFVLSYFLYPLENRGVPIRLFAGDGQGGFADSTGRLFPGGAPATVHARETVIADFNGDGRADAFFADHGYDRNPFPGAQNSLFLSSGATALTNATAQLPQVSDFTHSAEAADIDGDGDLDLFVGNGGGGAAYVKPYFLVNNGQGAFTRTDAGLPASVLGVGGPQPNHWAEAFLDMDGDGDKDLFLGSSTNSGARLLLNNGLGVFTDSGRVLPRGAATADAVDIKSLDVNGDGRPDLVISHASPSAAINLKQIQLLINDGAGGFTDETATRLPASIQTGAWSRRVHLTDLNGDGVTDLLLSNGSTTPFYLGDGSGLFIEMPNLLSGNEFDQLTPIDVNGDGRIDLVAWRGLFSNAEQLRVDLRVDAGVTQAGTAAAEGFMGDNDAETVNAGGGNDVIVGGGGQDFLRGDDGDDRIAGGADFDDVHGNMGNDTVSGGTGGDWVVGGKGDDVVYGDEGGDVLLGNLGADTCEGGVGDDVVRGGQDDDIVSGGAGDDFVSGDRGNDTISGGSGADRFHTFGEAGIDRVTDFNRGEGDRVELFAGTTFTLAQVGADTVINMTGGGQMILVGVSMSSLTGDWIVGG